MIALTFAWALSALLFGYADGTHVLRTCGWILLAMAAVMWLIHTSYQAYLRNANASELLKATAERRRDRGAL